VREPNRPLDDRSEEVVVVPERGFPKEPEELAEARGVGGVDAAVFVVLEEDEGGGGWWWCNEAKREEKDEFDEGGEPIAPEDDGVYKLEAVGVATDEEEDEELVQGQEAEEEGPVWKENRLDPEER